MAARTSARRFLAVLGAAIVGVAATLALSSPASAHDVTIAATPECDAATGEWVITWTVFNDFRTDATLQTVEITPAGTITGLTDGTVVERRKKGVNGKATGVQRVPGSTTEVALKVKALWLSDDYADSASKTLELPKGGCVPPRECLKGGENGCDPTAEFRSDCSGKVVVKLTSRDGKVTFVVKDAAGVKREVTVKVGEPQEVTIAAAVSSAIEVSVDGKLIKSGGWVRPADCGPPTLTIKGDCDTVTLTVTNPTANKPAAVSITYGTETKSGTVAGGASQAFTFAAGTATTAKATFADLELELEAKYTKPATCVAAPPGLPVTGSNVGGIIGGAAAAVALGAFLFLRFRRRRVTFTV